MQEKSREYSILKQRLFDYLDYKGISKKKCYEDTGLTNGILSQRTDLTGSAISTILDTYRDLNPDWWLLNEGGMIRVVSEKKIEHSQFFDTKLIDSTNEKLMLLVLEKDKRIRDLEGTIIDKCDLIELKNEKIATQEKKIESLENEKKAGYRTSYAAQPVPQLKSKKK